MTSVPKTHRAPKPLILDALKGAVTPRAPFWLMRQAGRYLPEYRAVRAEAGSFLSLCYNPQLAAQVTLQPVHRFGMDAAIIFSDILVIPQALGQELSFKEGEGPQLGALDIDTLRYDAARLEPVYAALERVRAELPEDKALIGFAGAPWTLACYMVQGHGDGAFEKVKAFAAAQPAVFQNLIDILSEAVAAHLCAQIKHGADTVQLFDSWAGLLTGETFDRWVVAPARRIVEQVRSAYPGIPVIGFPRGARTQYARYAVETGADALGIDQSLPMAEAVKTVGANTCLQGNLDPEALLEGGARLEREALRILEETRGRAFVFNLGHGVIKDTPPEHVGRLAEIIREFRR